MTYSVSSSFARFLFARVSSKDCWSSVSDLETFNFFSQHGLLLREASQQQVNDNDKCAAIGRLKGLTN